MEALVGGRRLGGIADTLVLAKTASVARAPSSPRCVVGVLISDTCERGEVSTTTLRTGVDAEPVDLLLLLLALLLLMVGVNQKLQFVVANVIATFCAHFSSKSDATYKYYHSRCRKKPVIATEEWKKVS